MTDPVSMNVKMALIKKQPCFSTLTDRELEQLAELLVDKHYKPDDIIVTQGNPVDSVFFIVNGTADVRYIFIENNERKFKSLAKLSTEQTIGLSVNGLYSLSGVRTATVVAETDMILLRLSVAALNGFALANPNVGKALHKNTSAEEG